MNPLFAIVLVILFTIAMGIYNAFLLRDDRTDEEDPENGFLEFMWHTAGAAVFVILAFTFQYFISIARHGHYVFWSGWQYAALVLSSFWLIYAGIVHKVALNKSIFYVGTRAVTDRLIRRVAKIVADDKDLVTITCAVLKISAFAISFLLCIL